jgi:K+-transporting ATPase ATPase C chain
MKTYIQNSEANLGQTLRASLGLLIFTLSWLWRCL